MEPNQPENQWVRSGWVDSASGFGSRIWEVAKVGSRSGLVMEPN